MWWAQAGAGDNGPYVGLVTGETVVFTGLPLLIGSAKRSSWRAVTPSAVAVAKPA